MAQPVGGDLYVSVPLSNISVAYMSGTEDFIADKVFPSVPTGTQGGQYWKYDKGNFHRTAAQKRAPRTESAGTGWTVSRDNYFADVNAVHNDVSDQDRTNAQNTPTGNFNLDRDGTILVTRDLLLRREKDWIQSYFSGTPWSQTTQQGAATAGTNQFIQWDRTSSTPIEDIRVQATLMARRTGFRPNRIILGWDVYDILTQHSQFLERIKYSEKGIVTKDLMASLWDIDEVLVPAAIENTSEERADDSDENADPDDFQFLYGKGVLLAYAAPNAGIQIPSAGYTFEWSSFVGSPARGVRIKKFRMEELASDRIEGETAYEFKVVSSDMGVFFADAIQ